MTSTQRFEVWKKDDDGKRERVDDFESVSDAILYVYGLRKDHQQTYWIRVVG